jgi:hypothetical protein
MKRLCLLGALSLFPAACTSPPPARPAAAPAAPPPAAAQSDLTMRGIKLFLYDSAIPGVERKPVLMVEADTFTQDAEATWRFEQARAIMFNRNTGEEEMSFVAARGMLKEDERAALSGGVTGRAGSMTMHLGDITWESGKEGGPGVARSGQPLRIEGTEVNLEAASVEVQPEQQVLILSEVRGEFIFGEPQT